MTQTFGNDLRAGFGKQKQSGACVSQIIESNGSRETRFLEDWFKMSFFPKLPALIGVPISVVKRNQNFDKRPHFYPFPN
jgi:hypothetical protein